MPILFIIAAFGFGLWIVASMAENVLKGFQQHFGYVPGKHIYGIPTDLKGKEFKRAVKVIEDWLAEYKDGIQKLIDKYGVDIISCSTAFATWDVPKGKWKEYRQSNKELRAFEHMMKDKIHPKMFKTDKDKTFGDYGWSNYKRKVSVILNEMGIKFAVDVAFH